MSSEYLDLSTLETGGEPLIEPVETADFTTSKAMPVGEYVSNSRTITVKKLEDGHFSFAISFNGGLLNKETSRVYGERFPLRTWLSTYPINEYGTDGQPVPGKTSSIAQYLRRCGLNPKGATTTDALIALVTESQTIAVGVFIGRTDKSEKVGNNWINADPRLKTKDFVSGVDAEGNKTYSETVVRDGKTYRAAPKVASFFSIR